jgi:hypothetical protein
MTLEEFLEKESIKELRIMYSHYFDGKMIRSVNLVLITEVTGLARKPFMKIFPDFWAVTALPMR